MWRRRLLTQPARKMRDSSCLAAIPPTPPCSASGGCIRTNQRRPNASYGLEVLRETVVIVRSAASACKD
jgi:hypothetical protein